MTDDSIVFLDTNVLLTATITGRPFRSQALRVFEEWPERGIKLQASAQVIREYLVVATRPPEVNGVGLSPAAALVNIAMFQTRLTILSEGASTVESLMQFIQESDARGKRIHDFHLAATAIVGGCDVLATANPKDFEPLRLPIEILPLAEVV